MNSNILSSLFKKTKEEKKVVNQNQLIFLIRIAGALEKDNYLKIINDVGFSEVKVVKETPYLVDVSNDLKGKILSVNVKALKRQHC